MVVWLCVVLCGIVWYCVVLCGFVCVFVCAVCVCVFVGLSVYVLVCDRAGVLCFACVLGW